MPDRAIVFIDGSNWYHSLKEAGIPTPGEIDIGKLSRKLVGQPANGWAADTPAVEAVRVIGKKVYCASPATGAQLAAAANKFIPLKPSFFSDCMY